MTQPAITKYEPVRLATDAVIVRCEPGPNKAIQVLLVERGEAPFDGKYALVGGFIRADESDTDAVINIVHRKTGIRLQESAIEQLKTYAAVNRDPRCRIATIASIAYLSCGEKSAIRLSPSEASYEWADVTPKGLVVQGKRLSEQDLAFDHHRIIADFIERMKNRLSYKPSILKVMPENNPMSTYRKVFGRFDEDVLTKPQTAFNRKYERFFKPTDLTTPVLGKDARLYAIDQDLL